MRAAAAAAAAVEKKEVADWAPTAAAIDGQSTDQAGAENAAPPLTAGVVAVAVAGGRAHTGEGRSGTQSAACPGL